MGLIRNIFSKKITPWSDDFHDHLTLLVKDQGINLILDVGANQGQYAMGMFASGYQGHIVSFEPGGTAHTALSANAAGNERWVVAPRMALGRKREKLALHTFDRTDMNSLLPPNPDAFKSFPKMSATATEEVPVERLDEVLKSFLPSGISEPRILLKVDTQGSELAILEGASGCLDRIVMLQLEVPVVTVYEGAPTWMDVLLPVHQQGFRPVITSPGFFSKKIMGMLDTDIVFLRTGKQGA